MQLNKNSVLKLIQEIQESRGKNQKQNLEYCRNILDWQTGNSMYQLETYLLLIPIQFDFFKAKKFLQKDWNQCFKDIENFFNLLSQESDFSKFGEIFTKDIEDNEPKQFCLESFYQFFRSLNSELYKSFRELFED